MQAGAQAVVIVNSQDSHFRAESNDGSRTLPPVTIPVVMIGKGDGDKTVGESISLPLIAINMPEGDVNKLTQRNRALDTFRRVRVLIEGPSCNQSKYVLQARHSRLKCCRLTLARQNSTTPNDLVKNTQIKLPNARGRVVEGLEDDLAHFGRPLDQRQSKHRVIMPNDGGYIGLYSLDCRAAELRLHVLVQSRGPFDAAPSSLRMWDSHSNSSSNGPQLVMFNSSHLEHILHENCSALMEVEAFPCAFNLISALVAAANSMAYGLVIIPSQYAPHILFSDNILRK